MHSIKQAFGRGLNSLSEKVSKHFDSFGKSHAYVTFSVIILNCIIFFSGKYPSAQANNWLSWITYMFGHGSMGHLMGNMLFLSAFGPYVESRLGHDRFIVFYLVCGIASAAGFFIFVPDANLIGASGAISGVLAVYPLLKKDLISRLSATIPVAFWFIMNVNGALYGFGNIAYLGHLAGGAMGVLYLASLYRPETNKH